MKTFKEFLEQRDSELYNEISLDSLKNIGKKAMLGGALALGLAGGTSSAEEPKEAPQTTIIKKNINVPPVSFDSHEKFQKIEQAVEKYADKAIEQFSSVAGMKMLDNQGGHQKIDGSKVGNELKDYDVHIFRLKGDPKTGAVNKINNLKIARIKAMAASGKQPMFTKSNQDGNIIFVLTEK